jgi:large subunit ribosomal protein L10
MANQKNIAAVASLKEKLEKAKGLVLTDYSGLTHKQLEDLRTKLKTVGAEFVVVKNSLLKIASENATASNGSPRFTVEAGPSAALFSYDETLPSLKELYKFIKINTLPKVKFGRLDGVDYEETQLARLAALPSKEILLSQLLYTMKANLQKLVFVLGEVKNVRQTN